MSDRRRDYGPAGCADGCAQSGCGCLILAVGLVASVAALVRGKKKSR